MIITRMTLNINGYWEVSQLTPGLPILVNKQQAVVGTAKAASLMFTSFDVCYII